MRVSGRGNESFLFLNGLRVKRPIQLSEHVQLLPAKCDPQPDTIIRLSQSETDIGVAAIFLRQVGSQLRVEANSPKELAVRAWNSTWDAVLLGAITRSDVVCNFQCDAPAEKLGPDSHLEVTNYYLRGLGPDEPHTLTEEDAAWIEQNFDVARKLLDNDQFRNAVHCLASFAWHSMPQARLAVLWSGIEGLFEVDSEIVFRLSLYIARFLEPHDKVKRSKLFADVKRLYKQRSAAVHGSRIKEDAKASIDESIELLLRLIRQCVTNKQLPQVDNLAP